MNKRKKNSKVPNLRFPEFEGDWDEQQLGEIADISSGGTPSRANSSYWGGDIPWVTTSLIDFNTIYDTDERITTAGLENSSAKLFSKGSLLMAMYGQGKTRGKVAMLGIDATTNQACASIVTNNSILYAPFLFQNLAKRYEEIRELSNQGGQENLSGTIIKQMTVCFPNLEEQKRIADFMSVIDQRIETQNKIIEKLETLIKGLRESFFNRNIRFPEFNEEWVRYQVSDLLYFVSTNTLSWEDLKYEVGDLYNLHYGLIHNGMPLHIDISRQILPTVMSSAIPKKYVICENGDIAFADVSEDRKDVAKCVEFVACADKEVICGLHTIHGKSKGDQTVIGFKGHMFSTKVFHDQVKKVAQGTKVYSVSAKILGECEVLVPNKAEQMKITQVLTALSNKITIEKQLVERFSMQKSQLLKSLFI